MLKRAFMLALLFVFSVGVVMAQSDDDQDKDGVPNDIDLCPNEFGSVAAAGCPDGDQDGVQDKDDLCPNEIGSVAAAGCPDGDQDGVQDKDDLCPNEQGVPPNGCPAPQQPQPPSDRDNDGITDNLDQCPDEAGIANNDGCPAPAVAPPFSPPIIPADADCSVTPNIAQNVNARAYPSLDAPINDRALSGLLLPAVQSWTIEGETWHLTENGWLSGTVTLRGGDCGDLPQMELLPGEQFTFLDNFTPGFCDGVVAPDMTVFTCNTVEGIVPVDGGPALIIGPMHFEFQVFDLHDADGNPTGGQVLGAYDAPPGARALVMWDAQTFALMPVLNPTEEGSEQSWSPLFFSLTPGEDGVSFGPGLPGQVGVVGLVGEDGLFGLVGEDSAVGLDGEDGLAEGGVNFLPSLQSLFDGGGLMFREVPEEEEPQTITELDASTPLDVPVNRILIGLNIGNIDLTGILIGLNQPSDLTGILIGLNQPSEIDLTGILIGLNQPSDPALGTLPGTFANLPSLDEILIGLSLDGILIGLNQADYIPPHPRNIVRIGTQQIGMSFVPCGEDCGYLLELSHTP